MVHERTSQTPELGLWATIHKETGRFIGRCGLLPWTIDGQDEVEVAYLLAKEYWGQGLGTEAARAIADYAFEQLHLSRLICLIDRDNQASLKVARNIGMAFEKEGEDETDRTWSIRSISLPARANPAGEPPANKLTPIVSSSLKTQ